MTTRAALHFSEFSLHQQVIVWATFAMAATTFVVRVVAAVTHKARIHRVLHVAVATIAAAYCGAYLVLIFGKWSQPEWASVTRWFAPVVWLVMGIAPVFAVARIKRFIEQETIGRAFAVLTGDDDGSSGDDA